MSLAASRDVNPDASGRPSPVVVRVYQLRTDTLFAAADYFALFGDDQKALGQEVVSRDEYTLDPSESRSSGIVLAGDTRFVGVFAAFRDNRTTRWRALIPVPKKGFTVAIERARIALSTYRVGEQERPRMSAYSKVVWSEGLFLQPHHLQQQDRYVERYVEQRCRSLVPFSWGFSEVELERDLLSIGKLALRRASGVFPDGTPMRMPDDDPLPEPLDDRRAGARSDRVPGGPGPPCRRTGGRPGAWPGRAWPGTRCGNGTQRHVGDIGIECGPRGRRASVAAAPGVRIARRPTRASRWRMSLNGGPTIRWCSRSGSCRPMLRSSAATRLATFTTELLGLLHQKGEDLGGRVAAHQPGRHGRDRRLPVPAGHQSLRAVAGTHRRVGALHPEALYRICVAAAGELATFTTLTKRPPAFPPYRHDQLRESFEPVMASLRAAFAASSEQRAIPIPIEERRSA